MAAIRKLITEAQDNGLIDPAAASAIMRIKSLAQHGTRSGYWLNKIQVRALLNAPDTTTLKGLRDRAILAVMIGAGLRRSEVANLRLENLQERDGRWAIIDIIGKGNRTRSIPIAAWCKAAIDDWLAVSGINNGYVFCSLDRVLVKNKVIKKLTPEALGYLIVKYGQMIGVDLACHDMRRSFAKLSYQGGASLDQIQLSLGHASIVTTERYLGSKQSYTDAPADHLGL
jgi:site-specific recombinase XerD